MGRFSPSLSHWNNVLVTTGKCDKLYYSVSDCCTVSQSSKTKTFSISGTRAFTKIVWPGHHKQTKINLEIFECFRKCRSRNILLKESVDASMNHVPASTQVCAEDLRVLYLFTQRYLRTPRAALTERPCWSARCISYTHKNSLIETLRDTVSCTCFT